MCPSDLDVKRIGLYFMSKTISRNNRWFRYIQNEHVHADIILVGKKITHRINMCTAISRQAEAVQRLNEALSEVRIIPHLKQKDIAKKNRTSLVEVQIGLLWMFLVH